MTGKKKYKDEISEGQNYGSALNINYGVTPPPQLNPEIKRFFKVAKELSVDEYVSGIAEGNINTLSRAITLVESKLSKHNDMAQKIIEKCLPMSGKSVRIGITGVPGAGKSTFIESLGMEMIKSGRKLAVLAVDPSSSRSGGSILGDKTRMEKLSAEKKAFIRPSPSAGSLGGVAKKTHEIIVLCEAAGYDTVFIETVGVGQSETTVHNMVDFFLLLMLAGAGDELQGIKRGIMEMADSIVITKSDGDNILNAQKAQAQYKNALHLFPPSSSGWIPKVLTCSAVYNTGITEVMNLINEYQEFVTGNNYFFENRKQQNKYWMYETINTQIKERFFNDEKINRNLTLIEEEVQKGQMSGFMAAKKLLDIYLRNEK